jgi:hypothetical protein
MDSVAMIAARMCGQSLHSTTPPTHGGKTVNSKPWRRALRTKAALAIKTLAIEKAIQILECLKVVFSQPLPGKLLIEPRPGVAGGKKITFWPARDRLRIARRPTETHSVLLFLQALAAQGHQSLGYFSRSKPPRPPTVSSAERLRERQEANLAEMVHAHAQRVEAFRQTLADDGHGIRKRDVRSARVRRLFQRAWLRPV